MSLKLKVEAPSVHIKWVRSKRAGNNRFYCFSSVAFSPHARNIPQLEIEGCPSNPRVNSRDIRGLVLQRKKERNNNIKFVVLLTDLVSLT